MIKIRIVGVLVGLAIVFAATLYFLGEAAVAAVEDDME